MPKKFFYLLGFVGLFIIVGFFFYFAFSSPPFSPTDREVLTDSTGWFETGQAASIMLSGIDFNETGGSLLFNHPGAVATDGQRLFLADTFNNRILIWKNPPTDNTEPDLVLGQSNFLTNNPGVGLNQMNWPVSVAVAEGKVVVADTYNNRLLIWNTLPEQNGEPADLVINTGVLTTSTKTDEEKKRSILWPWAVWTDGEKMIITSTTASLVLIWNNFPTQDDQAADLSIELPGFGTPRSIGSDGEHLVIGDHNAFGDKRGTFFWSSFPDSDNENYDFYQDGELLWGSAFLEDGRFLSFGVKLYFWDEFPTGSDDRADLEVGVTAPGQEGYWFKSGHASTLALVGDRLYISNSNGNKIVVYNTLPIVSSQLPDFAMGAPNINTNTLETNYFITNPVPATDGKSLLVTSDFDRKLYVWKDLPDESGAKPDFVYEGIGGWDNALHKNIFVVSGQDGVKIWYDLPLNGELPDLTFTQGIGSITFQKLTGVALDDRYFYLADDGAGKIYVWSGIPSADTEPLYTLDSGVAIGRMDSNGHYLVITQGLDGGSILVYKISELEDSAQPNVVKSGQNFRFNMPGGVIVVGERLLVADTGFGRVLGWDTLTEAIAGETPTLILGATDLKDTSQEIGKDKLFWPAGLAFDGSYLWVGEYKFSGRLLRFDADQ